MICEVGNKINDLIIFMMSEREEQPECKVERSEEAFVKVENQERPEMRQYPQFEAFNNYIQAFIASFHLSQKIQQLKARQEELTERVSSIEVGVGLLRKTSTSPVEWWSSPPPKAKERDVWQTKLVGVTSAQSRVACVFTGHSGVCSSTCD